jgi:hypothetical protein
MAPDWDRLSKEAHPSVFIYDVNCGDEAELCNENGVSGYPTIKYYQDGVEKKYEGARGFEELLKFTKENLELACDVANLKDTCSEKAQNYAEKVSNNDTSDIFVIVSLAKFLIFVFVHLDFCLNFSGSESSCLTFKKRRYA